MKAEHPLALSYLLPGDVYLLAGEQQAAVDPLPEISETLQVAEPEVVYQPDIKFTYTGGYKQKMLIVVHYPDHEAMEPAHLTALESTLKHKGMGIYDVAILNISKYPDTGMDTLISFFTPAKVLLLGKNTLVDGMDAPKLNQLTKNGDCTVLYSFSFNEMLGNKENTKAFWEQMKTL